MRIHEHAAYNIGVELPTGFVARHPLALLHPVQPKLDLLPSKRLFQDRIVNLHVRQMIPCEFVLLAKNATKS